MRITSLFGAYALLFAGLVAGLTTLTLRNIEQSRQWELRTELAHASLEEHLLLQSKVFQLLKQHGDAMVIGDRDRGTMERELRAKIAGSIMRIRAIIGNEIELVGEEEIEELELLARMERKIAEVTTALERVPPGDRTAVEIEVLADLLDQAIDVELSSMIDEAIAEEREEVAETRAEAQAFRDTMRLVTWVSAVLSIAVLVAAIWSYLRLVHLPFARMMGVVRSYGKGDFSRDVRHEGGVELRRMSTVLTEMATLLRQREIDQKEQNEMLERRVSERTRELERLLRQIEMSEANRRQMMADISHELRTPLTIIRGEAEVALRGGDLPPDEASDAFARIRDSARHTTQIVDDMLLVARHEAGALRLDPQQIDLRQIIAAAQDIFGAPVDVDIASEHMVVRVDPLRMRQCLLSVLHNAARYGGPMIAIRVTDDADYTYIAVSDDGPGMSDEDKAQAFERFYRGANAAHTPREGTGLGLPIVRAIMEAHGGHAALMDAPTGGLTVLLSLPRKTPLTLVPQGGKMPGAAEA